MGFWKLTLPRVDCSDFFSFSRNPVDNIQLQILYGIKSVSNSTTLHLTPGDLNNVAASVALARPGQAFVQISKIIVGELWPNFDASGEKTVERACDAIPFNLPESYTIRFESEYGGASNGADTLLLGCGIQLALGGKVINKIWQPGPGIPPTPVLQDFQIPFPA
jgi:hypothetical protein